ncbi:hypothetical protein BWQ96_04411 [Gracilariopsis chorda]|uniref:Uncharacterized protein n=1 Tax=Gracilariopsis chorda TaxID=448386 RepID=A0A2V3IUP1_9FLOR|nr:hypothetical protein BWQ96_04411 [Gracilariopsis chorda]|eukprot:PXF45799.1 hypothetical protein BWQ96_04411 [Gracilariopsis chorda]
MVPFIAVIELLILNIYTYHHALAITQLATAHVELPKVFRNGGRGGGSGGKGGSSSSGSKITGIKGSKSSGGKKIRLSVKQGIIIGVLILIVVVLVILFKCWLRRKRRLQKQIDECQPQAAET